MSTRRWAFILAIGATSTALCLSMLAGWQRGGSLLERLVWVAIGLVLVTSAHLLPALLRDAPLVVRGIGSLLWGACLMAACFGHAMFFTFAQQHAGESRASTVRVVPTPLTARSLTAVMADRATVTAQLAAANAHDCIGTCTTLKARRVTLTARLDALDAEADDVRRQQAVTDRVTAQRDALLVDPVTSRLAALLGVTTTHIDLLSGLMFAAVLEGVACLLWTVVLWSPVTEAESVAAGVTSTIAPVVTMTADVTEPVVASVVDAPDMTRPRVIPADAPIDDHLLQLVRDVTAGLVRPTVADIRRHLGCSQARAAGLRRQLVELNTA
ncbi:hypothetical protein BLA9940_04423 [Burkholderia aenigmatica]|uniref:hypothetical protein n=1 Tax=Burkholderia aenigmatica TaxID=2015348 RepID=UPI0014533841|nr:hypothetical protein [Burkholderia aenigmatica]VWC75538.1 hypothetical protein BLA9940_04423 [Burkholderia aenigmatica]